MIKNYFVIAWRHLRRHKGYALLNVMGLAVGLACCLLIGLYIQDELRYDRQHPHADRLYRLANAASTSGDVMRIAITPAIYAKAFAEQYPEVEAYARLHPAIETTLMRRGDQRYYEENVVYADSSFFDLFGFQLQRGDPATALVRPFSVVLTPALAQKYFGQSDPLGQTLRLNEAFDFTVTGVLAEAPSHSHLFFDAPLSMSTLDGLSGTWFYGSDQAFFNSWHLAAGYSYVRLAPGADPTRLGQQLTDLVRGNIPPDGPKYELTLQPVTDIHLRSTLLYDIGPNGNIVHLYVFAAVALFILLIACINYVNLATARSARRAAEVGMRKVIGARQGQLIRQFLSETVLLALVAMVVALALAALCLPLFNTMAAKSLAPATLLQPSILLALGLLALLVGLAAGTYPAFFLARFQPVRVLKGSHSRTGGHAGLRKGLVVLQFATSVALIIGTLIVYQQLRFFQHKSLGFDKEHVVVARLPDTVTPLQLQTIKHELRRHPGVVRVAASSAVPGMGVGKHDTKPSGRPEDERWLMSFYGVDYDFLQTLGFELEAGRFFDEQYASDSTQAYLLNEAAVARLGWQDDPIGREFTWINPGVGLQPGRVVGVLKDFHYESLSQPIEPAFFAIAPPWYEMLSVRLRPGDLPSTLAFLQQTWEKLVPAYPFDYAFLDESFGELYETEQRFGLLCGVFAGITVLIACLGLFGLAAFTAEQRTKEIGIRKVLGASVASLVALLSKDFLQLVALAVLVAAPIAYLVMQRWLADFAYRITIGPWVFVAAGALALVIALVTVSYQAVKAARTDPVKSIRYE